eukprot:675616-Rhodomonas_salina.2
MGDRVPGSDAVADTVVRLSAIAEVHAGTGHGIAAAYSIRDTGTGHDIARTSTRHVPVPAMA